MASLGVGNLWMLSATIHTPAPPRLIIHIHSFFLIRNFGWVLGLILLKEDNHQNLPSFSICETESPSRIWTNKKTASKNIKFWRSYGLSKFTIFRPSQKRIEIFPRYMTSLEHRGSKSMIIFFKTSSRQC